MSYRKGLQSLMIAVLLVGTGVFSAEAQEPTLNGFLYWRFLQDQFDVRYRAGDYKSAERLAQEALEIAGRTFPFEHPATATSLNSLALVRRAQGRYEEAEQICRRALAINEKVQVSPQDLITAHILTTLALVLHDQGRYGEAEPLYRRALAIREKVLGAEHPSTADTRNSLALMLEHQNRDRKAEPLYRRAPAIEEKAQGAEHPDTAASLNNLASLLNAQDRYEKAEPLYRRALAIYQQTETPANLLVSSRNLGHFLVARGRLQDAVPHYRTAIDTLDHLFAYTQGLSEEARQTFLEQYAYVYREFIDLLLKLHEQDPKAGYDWEMLAVASRNQSRIFSKLLRQADVQKFSAKPAFVELKRHQGQHFNPGR